MTRRLEVTAADGIRLAAWDYAGAARSTSGPGPDPESEQGRPGILLLHGLLGRASHWAPTARRFTPRYHAIALDQRGHGRSDKPEGPYTRDAHIADAAAAIEQLGLAPAVVVGHSMGALTAWQLAARHPDLVSAVVGCDMRASPLGEADRSAWETWFASWPLPFASPAEARAWFAREGPRADLPHGTASGDFYAELLEKRGDGWRPAFARHHIMRSREAWIGDAHWDDLARITCPALVVRGWYGDLGRAEAQEMVRVLPRGFYAEVPEAGHLAPWDQPEAWFGALEEFLGALVLSGTPAGAS